MKKNYLAPVFKVYAVKRANVIATSGEEAPKSQSSTESLTEKNFIWD